MSGKQTYRHGQHLSNGGWAQAVSVDGDWGLLEEIVGKPLSAAERASIKRILQSAKAAIDTPKIGAQDAKKRP
jgi:hypothetical protein